MQTTKYTLSGLLALGIFLVGWNTSDAQVGDPDPPGLVLPPDPSTDAVEPLVRGPVHEAYAQPVDLLPEPGDVIPKGPPDPIPEIPPDERPEGDNVLWIPGYWSWDPETSQFVWVSGVWRHAPEGRQWIPGHWVHTEEGWRWVPGFWAGAGAEEVPYTPEPPATLERGPTLPPPDAESVYVPGVWVYRESRFAWRPGYYTPFRPGHIWIHARYVWTPRGCVYVDGYWDYPLEERGILFTPVVFYQPLWRDPFWRYCPSFVVQRNFFQDAFFCNRGFRHYYYGNYYASARFQPWWGGSNRFDPYFQYYRATHRHDPRWANNLRDVYADRAAGRGIAPPTSFVQQQKLLARADKGPINRNVVQVVAPLRSTAKDFRLTKVAPAQLEAQRLLADQARDLGKVRAKFESAGGGAPKFDKGERRTLKLPAAEARITPAALDRLSPGKRTGDDRGPIGLPPKGSTGSIPPKGTPRIIGESPLPGRVPGSKVEVPRIGEAPRGIDPPRTPRIIGGTTPPKTPGSKIDVPRVIDTPKLPAGLPRVEVPKGPRIIDGGTPKGPAGLPRVEVPKTPRFLDTPKAPTSPPRVDPPRITPRVIEGPKFTPPPRVETPRPAPKFEAPRIVTPPKIEAPRRIETPRVTTPAPRIEVPRTVPKVTAPTPRVTAPRVSTPAPRISAPAPRISSPAPAPRVGAPRTAPRVSAPAPIRSPGAGLGGKGGGGGFKGGGGGRGKGR